MDATVEACDAVGCLELVYSADCSTCGADCPNGTEVQGMETLRGELRIALSQWLETEACAWPGRSTPLLAMSSDDAAPTREPLDSDVCAPQAAWEQLNDVHAARFGGADVLLVATKPNDRGDRPCGRLQGTVLMEREGGYVDTELGTRLATWYPGQSEVRYVVTHADGSTDCADASPCVFALASPSTLAAGDSRGASIWRGRFDPLAATIVWDERPEMDLSGVDAPFAVRLVSVADAGREGLFVGSSFNVRNPRLAPLLSAFDDCADPLAPACGRVFVARRLEGTWRVVWNGDPLTSPGAMTEVRGLLVEPDGLRVFTHPRGSILRISPSGEVREEADLVDSVPGADSIYGYQMLRFESAEAGAMRLVAAQVGGAARVGRLFAQCLSGGPWHVVTIPTIVDDTSTRTVNEAAVRWLHPSPFVRGDLFIGTTDMNGGEASSTARVYRLRRALAGLCL